MTIYPAIGTVSANAYYAFVCGEFLSNC